MAEKKKSRNFRNGSDQRPRAAPGRKTDMTAKKLATTCSSCGQKGHWRGDSVCPKVKSGQDKPFQPKNRAEQGVHLVQSIKDIPVLSDGKNLVAKEVNFTFMAARTPKPKEPPAKKRAATHCFHCGEQVQEIHKFCPFCGTSQAAVDMRDVGEDPEPG